MNEKGVEAAALSIRSLSMDAIQKANSGHPGMPLGAAEVVALLYGEVMKHNPANSKWADRDRFVLSAGHASMLLYSILHLSGYKVGMNDIKSFRQVGSKCPGHPEYGQTDGVECTAGPLGQGVAMAVGMALAETMLAARFNTAKRKIVDHYTYSLVGEGCLEEGVSSEASSLAGHLKLGKLIVFYDQNEVTIDGSSKITFTENIAKRYEAYGWQVLKGSMYDVRQIASLVAEAKKCKDKPTLIMLKSVIGKFSPKAGSADTHGAPIGIQGIKAARKKLGIPENEDFYVSPAARDYFAAKKPIMAKREADWNNEFKAWAKENPALKKMWDAFFKGAATTPTSTVKTPKYNEGHSDATRSTSGAMLNAIAAAYPNLVGGSADLSGPNKSEIKGGGLYDPQTRAARNIAFGIREFAMSAVCAGINLHGGLRPYCATFMVFSDYLRANLRLQALMGLNTIYIFTHDSIYVGEDGPTHQPIETLAALRAIPGVRVLRPGDAEETCAAWKIAMKEKSRPVCLALTRQNLKVYPKSDANWQRTINSGAYVVQDGGKNPSVVVLASGSEVGMALEAARLVPKKKIRVVSVLDKTAFDAQTDEQRARLFGGAKRVVVAEAGISMGWEGYVRDKKDLFTLNRFGESGPAEKVAKHLGFTAEKLAALL